MKITFAFALNHDGVFEKCHFGDSDQFVIYAFNERDLLYSEVLPNTFNTRDSKHEHGSKQKGNAIISSLKEKGVEVLVSKQFGKNIKMVNQHFIPVIIKEDNPDQVLEILLNHISWFKNELKNKKTAYMLFYTKNGILEMHVKRDETGF